MQSHIPPFKLLLKNPKLDIPSKNIVLMNKEISNILGYEFCIVTASKTSNFIFSCFALSVDGKLYYPDVKSGFSIAASNLHATNIERSADLFTLMLARTISDALIIGTNSLNNEFGSYTPDILYPDLHNIRRKCCNSALPISIVVCRDLTKIDFSHKLFCDNKYQVIICCINTMVSLDKLPVQYLKLDAKACTNIEKLNTKNLLLVDNLSELISWLNQTGFQIILNESPYFHHQLLQIKKLNELWLNYSGSYIGGNFANLGCTQTPFDSKNHPDCKLLTLHSLGYNFLYTRQEILYPE